MIRIQVCLVAEGKVDIYPRLSPTMEWDTGAAHAIINEASCYLVKYGPHNTKKKHTYNKESLLNEWFLAEAINQENTIYNTKTKLI